MAAKKTCAKYFWNWEYRHIMRELNTAARCAVYRKFRKLGLSPSGESKKHEAIIQEAARRSSKTFAKKGLGASFSGRDFGSKPTPAQCSRFKYNKFGLAEDPKWQFIMLRYKGRDLIGQVRSFYQKESAHGGSSTFLRVTHNNGESWPLDPLAAAVCVIRSDRTKGRRGKTR